MIIDELPPQPVRREMSEQVFELTAANFLRAWAGSIPQINAMFVAMNALYQNVVNSIATVTGLISTVNVNPDGLLVRSSNTALVIGDKGKTIMCDAPFTQTFAAASTLGNGWFVIVKNNSNGQITIDPAELIAGQSSYTLQPGVKVTVYCTGTAFGVDLASGSNGQNSIKKALRRAGNSKYY